MTAPTRSNRPSRIRKDGTGMDPEAYTTLDQQTAIIELAHVVEAMLHHLQWGPPESPDVYADLKRRLYQIQTQVQPDTETDQ